MSSAVGLEGESTDLVPQDDSVECSGQFESRCSPTGSQEPRISESMLQCVSESVLCALNVIFVHACVYVGGSLVCSE